MTTTFSVIIPTYNYAHTLARAFDSAVTQISAADELIVINDGSTDNTEEVIAQLCHGRGDSIRHIKQENRGPAATRNRGIDVSHGDYLIFLDADDELTPDALSYFRRAADNSGAEVLIGSHISVKENGDERLRPRPSILPADKEKLLLMFSRDGLQMPPSATAFHRRVFAKRRYPEYFRCVEDAPVAICALANFSCITIVAPLVRMHRHANGLRLDVDTNEKISAAMVDEAFAPEYMPAELMHLKKHFLVKRHLDLCRALFHAGRREKSAAYHRRALRAYKQAWRLSKSAALAPRYLRTLIRALVFVWLYR